MSKLINKIPLVILVCLLPFAASCILEEKVIEIVFTEQTTADFSHYSQGETFADPDTVDYADEIDKILVDNGIDKSEILSALVVSASYGVTKFPPHDDWEISGAILVERDDIAAGPDTLVRYSKVSVAGALGRKIPARLHRGGVSLLNIALQQYLADTHDPVLIFTVSNGDVDPNPSQADPIVFDWKGWLVMHIIVSQTFDVPDPF